MTEEVVVIGGGILGFAIGRALAREGLSVAILEAEAPGSGATSAALGSLTPYSDHAASRATQMLAQHSVGLYPHFVEDLTAETGLPIDFDPNGLLQLAFTESEVHELEAVYASLKADGSPAEWLEQNDAIALEPGVSRDVLAAIHLTNEPFLDVEQLFKAVVAGATSAGCQLACPEQALEIVCEGDHVTGVRTNLRQLTASHIVLAAGLGCSQLAVGFACPLQPVRGEVIEVRGDPGLVTHHLFCEPGFMTPRRDGRMLLGSTYENIEPSPHQAKDTITIRNALTIMSATTRMVPAVAGYSISRMWRGWRPKSPDDQPILGITPVRGLYVAAGVYGLGVTLTPAVAEMIADLVAGRPRTISAEFSATRF